MQGNVNLAPGCSTSGQFKCEACSSQFPLKEDLIVHQLLFHSFASPKPPSGDNEGNTSNLSILHQRRALHHADIRSINYPGGTPHQSPGLSNSPQSAAWPSHHSSRTYPPPPSVRSSSLPYRPHGFAYTDRPTLHQATVNLVHGSQGSGQYQCDRCGCHFAVREDLTVHHLLYHSTAPNPAVSYQRSTGNPRVPLGSNVESQTQSLPGGRHLTGGVSSSSSVFAERNPYHFGPGFAHMQSSYAASRDNFGFSNVNPVSGHIESSMPMYGSGEITGHPKALDLTYSETTYQKESEGAGRNYSAPLRGLVLPYPENHFSKGKDTSSGVNASPSKGYDHAHLQDNIIEDRNASDQGNKQRMYPSTGHSNVSPEYNVNNNERRLPERRMPQTLRDMHGNEQDRHIVSMQTNQLMTNQNDHFSANRRDHLVRNRSDHLSTTNRSDMASHRDHLSSNEHRLPVNQERDLLPPNQDSRLLPNHRDHLPTNQDSSLLSNHRDHLSTNQDPRLIHNNRDHLLSNPDGYLISNQTSHATSQVSKQNTCLITTQNSHGNHAIANHTTQFVSSQTSHEIRPDRIAHQEDQDTHLVSIPYRQSNQSSSNLTSISQRGQIPHKPPNDCRGMQPLIDHDRTADHNRKDNAIPNDHVIAHKQSGTITSRGPSPSHSVATKSSPVSSITGGGSPICSTQGNVKSNLPPYPNSQCNTPSVDLNHSSQQQPSLPQNKNKSPTKTAAIQKKSPLQQNVPFQQRPATFHQVQKKPNRMGPTTAAIKFVRTVSSSKSKDKDLAKVKAKEDVNLATGQVSGPHQCGKCGSGFQVKADLDMHLIVFHSLKKPNNLQNNPMAKIQERPSQSTLKRTVDDILRMLPNKRKTGGTKGEVRQVTVSFRCQTCDISFLTLVGFEEHQYTDHKCRTCEFTFQNKEQLQRHKIIAHMCGSCGHYFKTGESRKDHPCQDNICTICGDRVESKEKLQDHMAEQHKCSGCRATFLHKTDLDKHRVDKHGHRCRICGYHFKWKDGLKQHMLMSHGLKCVTCKARFELRDELDKHVLENHKCNICSLFFKSAESLSKHKNFIHICGVCRAVFKTRAMLTEHEDEMHKCALCSELFTLQKDLVAHRCAVHKCCLCAAKFDTKKGQDEHPCATYKCPCGANYETEDELELHSNDNHFCSYCDTFYLMKKEFANHRRTTHLCCICDALFILKANLEKHKESVHKCAKCGANPGNDSKETSILCACGESFRKNQQGSKESEPGAVHKHSRLKTALGAQDKQSQGEEGNTADPMCKNCQETFTDTTRLRQHERSCSGSHHEDLPILEGFAMDVSSALSCHLCDQQFESRGPLERHVRSSHPKGCDDTSENKTTAKDNPSVPSITSQSKTTVVQETTLPKNPSEVKATMVVKAKMVVKSTKVIRSSIVTGRMAYKCRYCQWRFHNFSRLNRHVKKHKKRYKLYWYKGHHRRGREKKLLRKESM